MCCSYTGTLTVTHRWPRPCHADEGRHPRLCLSSKERRGWRACARHDGAALGSGEEFDLLFTMRPLDSAGYSFALSIIRPALGRVTVGRCRCWCSIWVRSKNLIRRSTSRSTRQGWRGRCDDRVLGTRTGQPQSPASECDRDLFLCPGRRGDAHARRQRRRRAGFVRLHPAGELHEYCNGPSRTILFRVRYGKDFSGRTKDWPSNPNWRPRAEDTAYFAERR